MFSITESCNMSSEGLCKNFNASWKEKEGKEENRLIILTNEETKIKYIN